MFPSRVPVVTRSPMRDLSLCSLLFIAAMATESLAQAPAKAGSANDANSQGTAHVFVLAQERWHDLKRQAAYPPKVRTCGVQRGWLSFGSRWVAVDSVLSCDPEHNSTLRAYGDSGAMGAPPSPLRHRDVDELELHSSRYSPLPTTPALARLWRGRSGYDSVVVSTFDFRYSRLYLPTR